MAFSLILFLFTISLLVSALTYLFLGFHAGCHKRPLNLALVFCVYFVSYISFDRWMHAFVALSLVFSILVGLGKRLRNDLFCVEQDVTPQLNQSVTCNRTTQHEYVLPSDSRIVLNSLLYTDDSILDRNNVQTTQSVIKLSKKNIKNT